MQLQVKTILNLIQHFPGFVYEDLRLGDCAAGRGARTARHPGGPRRGSPEVFVLSSARPRR